jgi:hypothetical protein
MTFIETLNHLWVYHSVHILGIVGIVSMLEYDRWNKKKLANQQAMSYINN